MGFKFCVEAKTGIVMKGKEQPKCFGIWMFVRSLPLQVMTCINSPDSASEQTLVSAGRYSPPQAQCNLGASGLLGTCTL